MQNHSGVSQKSILKFVTYFLLLGFFETMFKAAKVHAVDCKDEPDHPSIFVTDGETDQFSALCGMFYGASGEQVSVLQKHGYDINYLLNSITIVAKALGTAGIVPTAPTLVSHNSELNLVDYSITMICRVIQDVLTKHAQTM
jgi:hypothetical protein